MSMIESIGNKLYDPSVSRSLAPVRPIAQGDAADPRFTRPPPPPQAPVPAGQLRNSLESRAGVIYQQSLVDDGANARGRQAVRAYRLTEDAEERDRVSRLLGIDEYA